MSTNSVTRAASPSVSYVSTRSNSPAVLAYHKSNRSVMREEAAAAFVKKQTKGKKVRKDWVLTSGQAEFDTEEEAAQNVKATGYGYWARQGRYCVGFNAHVYNCWRRRRSRRRSHLLREEEGGGERERERKRERERERKWERERGGRRRGEGSGRGRKRERERERGEIHYSTRASTTFNNSKGGGGGRSGATTKMDNSFQFVNL